MKKIRPKVLFFASWYPNRTNPLLGTFVERKARAVAALCDVAVVYVGNDPSLRNTYDLSYTTENGIPTVRVYFRTSPTWILRAAQYTPRFLAAYARAWSALKSRWGNPDIIHVQVADRAGLPALLLRWVRGFRYVITEHSTPDVAFAKGERRRADHARGWLKWLIWRFSSGGSVDSSTSLRFFEKLRTPGPRIVIPNVVDLEPLPPKPGPDGESTAVKVGLHISILNERKNVEDIIRAIAAIRSRRQDILLRIVGTGPNLPALKHLASDLGVLNNGIVFLGAVPEEEKRSLLRSSDFHVINSDEEGFCVAAAESLWCGIPVISTDCGGPEDFVSETNGIMVRRRDLDDLTRALETMLDTAHRFDRASIQKEAVERFSPDVVAEETIQMYRHALTRWPSGNTRTRVTIPAEGLVLDVGSGHQPHRRANVLLERYPEDTIHRTVQQVVFPVNASFVVGDAHQMPFKDRSFGYVIASHVAEHVDDPVLFCQELSRVGRAGYLETPGPLTERLMPTSSHRWIVSRRGTILVFRPNHITRPLIPWFFRFFYLNREGYVEHTWMTDNLILRGLNRLLVGMWPYVPYAYTRVEWQDRIEGVVVGRDS